MTSKRGIVAALLFALCMVAGEARRAAGERFYCQPYLGLKPNVALADRALPGYGAEEFVKHTELNLGKLARSADLIFIGINGQPRQVGAPDPNATEVEYEAEVRLYDRLKFKQRHRSLKFITLRWKASATGIGAMERHLFFVRDQVDANGQPAHQVLRAAYMTPDSHNRIRLFDFSQRIRADLTLEVLQIHAGKQPSQGYAAELAETLRSDPFQIPLLAALPVEQARGGWHTYLRHHHLADSTDLYTLGVLANDIIERGNDDDLLLLLEATEAVSYGQDGAYSLSLDGINRLAESLVFDLFRHHGNARLVKLLTRYGDKSAEKKNDAELLPRRTNVVSAAFALAEIGGEAARTAIERWNRDERLRQETTRIGGEFFQQVTYGDLFQAALKRLDEKKREPPQP